MCREYNINYNLYTVEYYILYAMCISIDNLYSIHIMIYNR
jgi:hypothetical protein